MVVLHSILGRGLVVFAPNGMRFAVLRRPEALDCRVCIPPETSNGFARDPPSGTRTLEPPASEGRSLGTGRSGPLFAPVVYTSRFVRIVLAQGPCHSSLYRYNANG